ncbi:LOB domain-containing protein 31-like [Herrania umbratica]|uniref:LOB domain-containing protein 31-like n=1 Tax=Herrania umbratica TaxID=108875 RepID=A0A6J1A055_9ROSI|nr:LOB domain-containing protein 31-like [Herrania umbratica]
MSANNGGGPCGACKFLRRKCVKGCIFAPYFDSDQGTAHFAAVHKVFGASNASKMLLRIPAHKRVDAVVTLCYEALARVRDPVYGCVGHIFTLQQQVVNLQAELAYIQARLSTLQLLPPSQAQCPSPTSLHSSSEVGSDLVSSSNMSMSIDRPQPQQASIELTSFPNPFDQELENEELQALAREFVSRYLPGVRFRPSTSS